MKLSILIPSLCCRTEYLTRLLTLLNKQITKEVEILISIDNADKQIGAKRNELMNKATGEYVVFIDDDDLVSDDYIKKVLEGCVSGKDYISYEQEYHNIVKGTKERVVSHFGATWGHDGQVYIRGVQHICPIKRSLAVQYQFPDKSFGEDREWGYAMDARVTSEYFIGTPMYFYEYRQFKREETTNGNKE